LCASVFKELNEIKTIEDSPSQFKIKGIQEKKEEERVSQSSPNSSPPIYIWDCEAYPEREDN